MEEIKLDVLLELVPGTVMLGLLNGSLVALDNEGEAWAVYQLPHDYWVVWFTRDYEKVGGEQKFLQMAIEAFNDEPLGWVNDNGYIANTKLWGMQPNGYL